MPNPGFNVEFCFKMPGNGLCSIYTSVLSAGAAKIDLKIFKSSFNVIFHRNINNVYYMIDKLVHPRSLFQEVDDFFVFTGKMLVFFKSPGIHYSSAVEYKTSSVTGYVFRNCSFIRKAVDFYHKVSILGSFYSFKLLNDFIGNHLKQNFFKFGKYYAKRFMLAEPFQVAQSGRNRCKECSLSFK